MRLIEKECPNCGAGLHFEKDDTTCKCEYCKREFEIERDTEKKSIDEQYILNELKTPFKIFSYFTIGSFITQAVITIVVFIIIIIVAISIIKGFNDSNSMFNRGASLITDTSELNISDYSTLDLYSNAIISKEDTGSYLKVGKIKRENLYIISNDKTNYLIPVYKVTYNNFTEGSSKRYVYIPVIYKNVKRKNNSIAFYLDKGELIDHKYYFNDDDYMYGYSDLDTLYDEVIKQYEKDYNIVKK